MESATFGAALSIKLLVVEDDKNLRELLADYLTRPGLIIDAVSKGKGACEKVKNSPYDIVLTEIALPGASYLEVLKAAKDANPSVLVIIITDHASFEKATGALKKGAYDFVIKPFRLDELHVSLSHAIEKVKLMREREELSKNLKVATEELRSLKRGENRKNRNDARAIGLPQEVNIAAAAPLFEPLPIHYSGQFGQKGGELVEKLDRLNKLREKGAITEDEYFALKAKLFSSVYGD